MFYSLVLLLRKVASSVALPLSLLVLEWSGYVPNAVVQAPGAVRAIQVLIGPVPASMFGTGIVFALFYPLGRDSHSLVRSRLAGRVSPGAPGS